MNSKKKPDYKLLYDKSYEQLLERHVGWSSPSEMYSAYRLKKSVLELFLEEINGRDSLEVADFGCGTGNDIFMLNSFAGNKRVSFTGFDLSGKAVETAKGIAKQKGLKNVRFFQGDAQDINLGKKFDVIISSEVLEHLPEPQKHLKAIAGHLKKNGALIISTPNGSNLFRALMRGVLPKGAERKARKWCETHSVLSEDQGMEHEFEFHISVHSKKELVEGLKKAGLFPEKAKRGTLFYGGEWIDRHNSILLFLIFLDSIVPRNHFINLGWNMVFRARKK